MRNRLLAVAALTAAAAGCRRAPPAPTPDPANGVSLAAPPAMVASPLGTETTSYTNEMQAQNLRDQAGAIGISKFGKSPDDPPDAAGEIPSITYHEGLERTRASERQFAHERHAIDRDKDKTVAIPSGTPGIIPANKDGSPIESVPDDAGPKVPDQQ